MERYSWWHSVTPVSLRLNINTFDRSSTRLNTLSSDSITHHASPAEERERAPQSPHCHKCWVCCLTSSQEAGGGVYTVCSSRLLRFSNVQASIRGTFLFNMDNWTNQERLVCCLTSSQEARGAVYTVFSSRLLRFSNFQVSSKFSVWTMDVACLPQRLRYLMVTLKGGGRPGIY